MKQLSRVEIAAALVAALGVLSQSRAMAAHAEGLQPLAAIEKSRSSVQCNSGTVPLCKGKHDAHDQHKDGEQSQGGEGNSQVPAKKAEDEAPSKDKDGTSKSRDSVCGVLDKQ